MKTLSSALLLLSLFSSPAAFADCQPLFQDEMERISDQLIRFKHQEKKVILGTAIGVGAPVGILGGTALFLIADGATIPAAILSGVLFGTGAGSIAAGAVAVPLITYNQIQKARVRALGRVVAILDEARDLNENGKHLGKLLRQMRREDPELDMVHLITALNLSNSENLFCSSPDHLDRLRQLRKHLLDFSIGNPQR